MTPEFESELLKINQEDLYKIHKTLLELLKDGGYYIEEHPAYDKDFDFFKKFIMHIKQEKIKCFIKHLISKKTSNNTKTSRNKKIKLASIPERGKIPFNAINSLDITPGGDKCVASPEICSSEGNLDGDKILNSQKTSNIYSSNSNASDKNIKRENEDIKSDKNIKSDKDFNYVKSVNKGGDIKDIKNCSDLHSNVLADGCRLSTLSFSETSTTPISDTDSKIFCEEGYVHKYYDPSLSFFESSLTFVVDHKTQVDRKIIVFFSIKSQIGKPALITIGNYLKSISPLTKITDVIFISSLGLTPSAQNEAMPEFKSRYNTRLLSHQYLLVNITKHKLVKPHIRLTQKQKKKFMSTFKIKGNMLIKMPLIKTCDPVALYYDFIPGEIIKIKNRGFADFYRYVVE